MPPEILRLLNDLHAIEPRVYLQLQTFDLGGISLEVTAGVRTFEFFSGPVTGIAVSEVHADTMPFTAHDRYFETLTEATSHLLSLVREAAPQVSSRAA